ncbi:MAG: ATP-binding protein [Ancalomicrobiaceae bacterium]|nr:ATP-binding protein [Ancalomicrobiaceae bacterium]
MDEERDQTEREMDWQPSDGGPDARALAAVAAVVLIGLHFLAQTPLWATIIGWLAIVVSAWLVRRPASAVARRLRVVAAPIVWPNSAMKALADALPDPCIITDARGIVRYTNDLASQRFGVVPRGEPLNFRLRATALNDALEEVVALDQRRSVEWQEKIPTDRWFEAHLAPIHLAADPQASLRKPDFVVLVIEDLTEQRRSERMRADFVANASHELRTPLASLTGFIETLQGPARNDAPARDRFLAIMAEQAARMKRLIDDLLSLSRIEMKAHVRPDTPIDLADILRHVTETLTPLAADNSVVVATSLPQCRMPSRGDRDELVQVFSNLIENAIKYGASGGRVEVVAGSEPAAPERPQWWTIAIRDHGPGIAAEHLPRLTERFYRADIDTSRQKQGTGLGLAIVKHILTRHRGRLGVESLLGEGATFTVRLEADVSVGAGAENSTEAAAASGAKPAEPPAGARRQGPQTRRARAT